MATAKKTTAKKTTAKKTTAKKTTAKKTTAKKTTAKKTTAKKTTAKKTTTSLVMEVPEVPRQKSPQRFTDSELERTAVTTPNSPSKVSIVPPIAKQGNSPRRGKPLKVNVILVLVIGLIVLFSQNLDSSEESNKAVSENVEIENEVTTPTETPTSSPTPIPTPSAAPTTEEAPIENASVQSRFVYTSTGIKLSWILSGADSIESVEVSVVENNGESQKVGSYGPDTKFVEFLKEDNAGRASFTVSLLTKTGQKIIAPSLDVRGKFSAK